MLLARVYCMVQSPSKKTTFEMIDNHVDLKCQNIYIKFNKINKNTANATLTITIDCIIHYFE